ncbi:F-box/LRR-repeat protein 4 isoform X2 [Drosophila rhopaloa]|uniref:F-box/LRR-repeat protein 4 isoform X2 n=1 Tax=Drosophila rhopaloa TaxID=1041015 RepID=A0A6P4DWT4_DRORH|nr:F-box/LRR-repeat protein 4 isoform X2 [Drosophila rhopaloa]
MSLLAYVEPGESSDTEPEAEAEPDALVDFTAMLRQRQREYGGWFGCGSKMQAEQSDQGYYLEQYVLGVLDFSSQYGIDYSISYTAANVIGRPTKFPAYGDYPETFPMRTYGDWWQRAPSATREIQAQNLPKLATHDYIVVYFEEFVVPTEVAIFETFNPGAVVRIWAYGLTKHWTCLWEATESDLARPALDSRRFAPALKKTTMITKTLRIDFNHSRLNYYTEIDAIMLCGRTVSKTQSLLGRQQRTKQSHQSQRQALVSPPAEAAGPPAPDGSGGPISYKLRTLKFQPKCHEDGATKLHDFINNDLSQFLMEHSVEGGEPPPRVCLTDLPFEILLRILSYLDLKSLFRVGQVSRTFYDISTHPLLYAELSLKPYWHVASSELLCTLARRATMLRKLDLSWCGALGNVSPTEFKKFLTQRGDNLTHLRLNSCKFLNASCIENVGIVCDNLIELSLRNCATDPPLLNFSCLANLKNLERLDLFQTAFETELLLSMLEGNRKLKHLNLAFCGVSVNMDNVAAHLATYNTQLISLDLWKAHFLSARGLLSLTRLHQLEELDLGWCLREASLGDGLFQLLSNCPNLKKLFLSAVRGTTERDLMHIAALGKNLEQLDLMGILNITHERVYDILVHCPKLQLLDLSFCDNIMDRDFDLLAEWSHQFTVDIKTSRRY